MVGCPGCSSRSASSFALLAVNAFFPVRREPFTVVSFVLGWSPASCRCTPRWWSGGRHRRLRHRRCLAPRGLGGSALAVAVGLAGRPASAWPWWPTGRAPGRRGPGRRRRRPDPGRGRRPASPAWTAGGGWCIAVPFRFAAIRRIRNIDYAGDGSTATARHPRAAGPVRPTGGPVLVYIHGGAWVIGDKREQGLPMMHELVQRGWVCVAINYRLSPKATWPDHIVDCKRALAWVRDHIAEYGGDPSFIAVSGGSAGGHLSALVALTPDDPEWQPGFEDADTSVDACVPFYGVYDMTGDPERRAPTGTGLVDLLERRVMKCRPPTHPAVFERGLARLRRVHAGRPAVLRGPRGPTTPWSRWRWPGASSSRLRAVSTAPVAYVELPRAQHAFDVLASIRCRHTTLGAVRFLEGVRAPISR